MSGTGQDPDGDLYAEDLTKQSDDKESGVFLDIFPIRLEGMKSYHDLSEYPIRSKKFSCEARDPSLNMFCSVI